MRVEESLAESATGVSKISSSGKGKRKGKRSESMPTVVQRVFDTCREVFDDCGPGIIPAPEKIGRLRSVLVQDRNLRLAKVNTDTVFTAPCETSILYPAAGGNMHCFTAKTSCAVLDVLGPPYNDSEKRHCVYYNAFPCASNSGDPAPPSSDGEQYAWLEERGKPDELVVLGAKYKGPRIVEH